MNPITTFRRWLGDLPETAAGCFRKSLVAIGLGGPLAAVGLWAALEGQSHRVTVAIAILMLGVGLTMGLHGLLYLLGGFQLLLKRRSP